MDVVVADFTPTPYEQQMRIARASHLIIGMHGAGAWIFAKASTNEGLHGAGRLFCF